MIPIGKEVNTTNQRKTTSKIPELKDLFDVPIVILIKLESWCKEDAGLATSCRPVNLDQLYNSECWQ
jgi:hypothetical protein